MVPRTVVGAPLHGGEVRAPSEVFDSIFEVFLILGTLVGVVVVTYTLYHAIKYRESASEEDPYAGKVERPSMGEMPTGGSGGRKVFYSFGISAIIVISLIAWTYSTLAYIEDGPDIDEEELTVGVEGYRFGWTFTYPNGHESSTLRVPRNQVVRLQVTSSDVFHNFGILELRVKTDAVPGQTTSAWFTAEETGEYTAKCYELCGSGHSVMVADVIVMPQDEYESWYASTGNESASNQTASRLAAPTGGVPA